MAVGPTRTQVRVAVGRRTGISFTGTADSSGGTTTNFADTNEPLFGSSGVPARGLAGGWILPTSGSEQTERLITTMASAGNATVSPAWTGAQNSVTYEYHTTQPSIITQAIRDAVRRLRVIGYIYPSLVVDGDMEYSDTSAWSSSSATLTKSAEAGHTNLAQQSLRVANSAANGYAQSAQITVAPGEVYDVWALVAVDVGTATLRAYDNTGAATIADVSTVGENWQWLKLTVTIPAGSRDLRLRLLGTASTTDAYWNLVLVRRQDSNRVVMPYWMQTTAPAMTQQDILSAERMYFTGQTVGTDAYEADVLQTKPINRVSIDSHPNSVDWYLTFPFNFHGPVRVRMWRTLPDPTADTTTIPLHPSVIEAETILEVYRIRAAQAPAADRSVWMKILSDWENGDELRRARNMTQRRELTPAWGRKR